MQHQKSSHRSRSPCNRDEPGAVIARPLTDESADEAEEVDDENMPQESQASSESAEDQNLASDSSDSSVVARKAADPYSPPDSDEDPPAPPEADDEVKMPVKQPPTPEGLKSKLLTSREKEAILRKELNIPTSDKNIIITKTTVKGSPSSAHAKVKVEYIEQNPPETIQMKQDEKKEGSEISDVDTKGVEPTKVVEKSDQGLKEKVDERNKEKEQKAEKATEKPKEANDEKVKEIDNEQKQGEEPKTENVDKQGTEKEAGQDNKEKVSKDPGNPNKLLKRRLSQIDKPKKSKKRADEKLKEKKRGLKAGHEQRMKTKTEVTPEGSGDTAGDMLRSAKS